MSRHQTWGAKVLPKDFVLVSKDPVSNLDHLEQGSRIFIAGKRAGSYYHRMRKRGFTLHQQRTVLDGVGGIVMWAEPIEKRRG